MPLRILLAPIHGSSLLEMLPIAQKMAADGLFEPLFVIFRDISSKYTQLIRNANIRLINLRTVEKIPISITPRAITSDIIDVKKRESNGDRKRLLRLLLSWDWFSFFFYLLKFSRLIDKSRNLVISENVAAVLIVGDRHLGWETALIKVANERDLPTLIVPFAVSDPNSDVEGRLRKSDADRYRVKTLLGRIVRRFYPNWVRDSDDGELFFIPPGEALAGEVLGIMPQHPWTIGGGAARRMAVESHHALQNYLKEGIPKAKMVVTGKPSVDQVFTRMQALNEMNLREELGLKKNHRIILCSVPQLAEHQLMSWQDHWQEMEFLFESLSKEPGADLVLSLHPQSEPDAYSKLADHFGAVIAKRRIYDLIPLCDILVATYSSVVVQAIGCRKPAIIVDFYGLDFSYYDIAPGVLIIKDRDALVPTVHSLLHDQDAYQQLVKTQRQHSSNWVLLDGGCTQRVINEMYQMIES